LDASHFSRAADGGRRWALAAYGFAAAMILGVGACMWGIPLPLTDNVAFLLEMQPVSLAEILRERFLATNYFRPLFFAQMKALLSLSNGHYFITFRGFHVLQMAVTVLLFTRVLRVRTAISAAAFSVALMVFFGMHTLTIGFIEGPLTAVFCCVLAMNLSFADRPSVWRTVASMLLLAYAALSVELGLLVWVCYASAFIAGCRGLSRGAIVLNTLLLVAYFALRFLVLPSAEEGLVHRETGVGFGMLEPDQAVAAVGGSAAYLYAYNIGSSILSVLFSEPRGGIWEFVRRYQLGEVAPWQWIHVLSSTLTTLCLLWYALTRVRDWVRLSFTREDRLVFVFGGVLAASAVMSFAYTREAVLGPAGVLYAMSIFVVIRELLARLPAMHWAPRAIVVVAIAAVSLGWSARAAGLTYVLRDSAFERRNDWARGIQYLEESGHMPTDAAGRALVSAFRDDALARPVPSPRWAQPWLEEYVDRSF
jgi:hypothetical protein